MISEALCFNNMLLPFATFTTLFDICNNEKFSYNVSEYFERFVDGIRKEDQKNGAALRFYCRQDKGRKGSDVEEKKVTQQETKWRFITGVVE